MTHYHTRGEFARDFLAHVGAEPTTHNTVALMAWIQAEGDGGRFNPLNATLYMPGSVDFNSIGVKNYQSYADGVTATARTLNAGADRHQFGYGLIRHCLRTNATAHDTLEAVANSAWGTGALALKVLEEDGWKKLLTYEFLHHRLVH